MLSHALKHLALRLWLTVFIGGLGSLALVPLLQALMGLTWVALPVVLFLIFVFLGIGWGMNAWAGLLAERLRAEGAVWERAGMRREATQRYEALMGLADSFMFSPRRRRRMLTGLLPRLTRFYLDQGGRGPVLSKLLRAHLAAQPGDAKVAARWLRIQLDGEEPPEWAHDLAQRIGETLPDNDEITALLVRFCLANSRGDHAAVDLYRRYWKATPEFRQAKAVALAQLLSMEGHRDLWALDVYLTAWSQGAPKTKLGPMIQRCLTAVAPADEGHPLLVRARKLVGRKVLVDEQPPVEVHPGAVAFTRPGDALDEAAGPDAVRPDAGLSDMGLSETDLEEEAAFIYRRRSGPRRPLAAGAWVAGTGRKLGAHLAALGSLMGQLGRQLLSQLRRPWGKALGLALLALALIVLITNTVQHLRPGAATPPPAEPAAAPPVTDPFTIQVAAYLKAEDAKQFAAKLKSEGLDAYWTEAVGAKRSWYQVRIDHFATKTAARKFGQDLKAKGLINDFYVANYRPPQRAEQK